MRVVLITIPGNERRHFAHELSKREGVELDLVIIQAHRRKPLKARVKRFFTRSIREIVIESYYGLLLRLQPHLRRRLRYFIPSRGHDGTPPHPATMEVDSVNGEDVYLALSELSPDLLVVWGNTILDKRILSTAKRSVNLHFGLCPFYRGALSNQYAVMCDDFEKLGATIHYMEEKPDTGEILATLTTDNSLAPEKLFQDLYQRALKKYLDTVQNLAQGQMVASKSQDTSASRNFLLKDWKPSVRYKLAQKIMRWEKEHERRPRKF